MVLTWEHFKSARLRALSASVQLRRLQCVWRRRVSAVVNFRLGLRLSVYDSDPEAQTLGVGRGALHRVRVTRDDHSVTIIGDLWWVRSNHVHYIYRNFHGNFRYCPKDP